MHCTKNPCENRVAHAVKEASTHIIRIHSPPPQRLYEKDLQKALEDHFPAGLIVSAFHHDKFGEPT